MRLFRVLFLVVLSQITFGHFAFALSTKDPLSDAERIEKRLTTVEANRLFTTIYSRSLNRFASDENIQESIAQIEAFILEKQEVIFTDKALLYHLKGMLHMNLSEPETEKAIASYEIAAAQNFFAYSIRSFMRGQIVEILISKRDIARALEAQEEVAKSLHEDPRAYYAILSGILAFHTDDYEQAVDLLEGQLAESDLYEKEIAHVYLYAAHLALNEFNEALFYISELNRSFPESPTYFAEIATFSELILQTPDERDLHARVGHILDKKQLMLTNLALSGDKDAQPIVRIPPKFPKHCIPTQKETVRVTIEFDVDVEGRTENIKILKSNNQCFNEQAIRTIERWRYNQKKYNDKLVKRKGVRASFIFHKRN